MSVEHNNLISEYEARKKKCGIFPNMQCSGAGCMAWRWHIWMDDNNNRHDETHGKWQAIDKAFPLKSS